MTTDAYMKIEETLNKLQRGIWVDTNNKSFTIVDWRELKEALTQARQEGYEEAREQMMDIIQPDLIHSINPENLFKTIRNAIKEYEAHK